jgi:hypothetical protein
MDPPATLILAARKSCAKKLITLLHFTRVQVPMR